ncbi:MAG TPA: ABC transporter substrate-binding protein [Trueperaceae bacterium]
MKYVKRSFIALAAVLMIFGSPATAQDSELEEVTLATLAPSALLWLHAIAVDQDFYAANGVRITPVQAQSSAALAQAVASGSANAGVALGDNVMRAIDEGAPLVISGAILSKPILRLIGTTESAADLAGKRVTGGAVTGGTSDLLLYQLMNAGVQPDQVQVVGIPNSRDRLVGFQNGQLEGGLLIAPFDILALREGFNLLDVYKDYWLETPLILNRDWAEANPEAAKGVTKAFANAAAWIYEPGNRDDAVRILSEYTGIEEDIVQEAYDFIVVEQQAISPDLSVPADSLRNILVISQAVHGGEMPDFDLSTYYDPSYLE